VIATGGLIELAALQTAQSVVISQLVDTKAGLAALLKIFGGVVVWFGFHERAGRVIAPAHSLSAAVAAELAPPGRLVPRIEKTTDEYRWTPSTSATLGLVGYALVMASFWFDGHTVSKGPWAIHSLINLVHLGAAAVWGGGVFAMTTVAWRRRRSSEHAGLAAMVIRFSTLATLSLIAVIVAGLTMTVLILDTPGDLVATSWGRILIAKTLAVGVAAAMGGYNHFKLRPALERSPDDPALAKELQTSLTIESIVFGVVVVLTAWLVASAT
jgi:copper transport protein